MRTNISISDTVLFYCDPYREGRDKDSLLDGHVTDIYENGVLIHYLYGHKGLVDVIPFEDIYYIADKEEGEYMNLPGYRGWFRKAVSNENSFEEKLHILSKSIGAANVGEGTDEICREVRGKE